MSEKPQPLDYAGKSDGPKRNRADVWLFRIVCILLIPFPLYCAFGAGIEVFMDRNQLYPLASIGVCIAGLIGVAACVYGAIRGRLR